MSVKMYRPSPDDDHVAVKTDILEDWPQRMAREQLVPMIAKSTRNALNTVPVYVEQFQQLTAGRRCSCLYAEDDAAAVCVLCFGTGVVGGYQKRGCKVEVLDVTAPYAVCVNTRPEYGRLTRPVAFALLETAVRGTIDLPFEPVKNLGVVDTVNLYDSQPEGCSVTYFVRNTQDVDWVPYTDAAMAQRLGVGLPMRIRVDMRRATPKAPIPRFLGARISYRTARLSALRCDIPRPTQSKTLEEFGIYQSFSSQLFAFGNDVKVIRNEDFFVVLQDGTRWKVVEYQDNRILGINTAWDVTCRLIQNYEAKYRQIPLGLLDVLPTQLPPDGIRSMQTETDVYESKGLTHGRLPGERADIDRAHSLAVGIQPGAMIADKPVAER